MPRLFFDAKIVDDRNLRNVETRVNDEDSGKWDAVSLPGGDAKIILETFDSEQEAKDYVNTIIDKMLASEAFTDVVDVRMPKSE